MQAIMLAAGEGTRCYPFTYLSPKITQEIGGIPLLEYMLSWFGGTPEIEKLYLVVRSGTTVEILNNYIQKRKPYLTKIVDLFGRLGYQVEYTNPNLKIEVIGVNGWGTGGDLRLAIKQITSVNKLGKDFLVCYADYVIVRKLPDEHFSPQLNLSDIITYHKNCTKVLNTVMTMALVTVEREAATRFGVAQLEEVKGFNLVRSFIEKPEVTDIPESPPISAGIYVMDSDFILSNIDRLLPDKPNTDLSKTLLEHLAKDKRPKLAAYLLDLHAWFDVGMLEELVDVNIYVASRKRGYIPQNK
ncbi:NDP-sugar synthase [Chloroflexota bacterium]